MWYKLLDTTVYLTYMVQLMVSSVGKIKLTQKIVFINDLPPRKEKGLFFKKRFKSEVNQFKHFNPTRLILNPEKPLSSKQDYCTVDIQYLTVGGRLKSKTSVLPWTGCMG